MDEYAFGHKPINSFFDQEGLAGYRPGGYHRVCLGDHFKDGRYQVHHKLGWGGFSTVWLTKDKICEEWVAVKILTANSKQEKLSKELGILRELSNDTSKVYAVRLLDDFYHKGPNGRHQCLVFELLGPSLNNVINRCNPLNGEIRTADDRIDSHVVLRVSKQLLGALAILHAKGIAHGDISSHNIAFSASRIRNTSEPDISRIIGTPVIEDLIREDGKPIDPNFPKHIVRRAEWDEWLDEDKEDIRLIDWGESFRWGQEPAYLAQPIDCKAPETIFTDYLDYRTDLWRAGIVIYHIVFGSRPFMAYQGDDFLVSQMIHFIEDLPDEWKGQWMKMKEETPRPYDNDTGERIVYKSSMCSKD
ncbi:kinase-like domain-containing protein [Diaporthe sp. PMI_573]|nr:kinase-like domain-containing protein [Diaporthaceae sp. PMI_573]